MNCFRVKLWTFYYKNFGRYNDKKLGLEAIVL